MFPNIVDTLRKVY